MECDHSDLALPLISVLKFGHMLYNHLFNRLSHLTFFTAPWLRLSGRGKFPPYALSFFDQSNN